MTSTRTFLHAFAGGEMSPEMAGRVDDSRRQQGAKRVRNFLVTPQGPLTRRQGSRFVRATKGNGKVRLVTFKFSATQTIGVQIGAGYFRFLSQCQTVLLSAEPAAYVASKNIVAGGFNTGGNQITVSVAHGFVTGDPVLLNRSFQDVLPFDDFTVYYVIFVSATVIRLAATAADAAASVPITFAAGALESARIHFAYETRDLVRFGGVNHYCQLRHPRDTTPAGGSPGAMTTAGNFVNQAAHGFVGGTAVVFAGSLLPPTLVAGRIYYVLNPGAGSYSVSATPGGALISLGTGSGTATRATHWHALESDSTVVANGSVYEVPNTFTEDDLSSITWDTSFDIMTLAHPNHPVSELRRFGATSWDFVPVEFGPTVPPPAAPTITPTVGRTFGIVAVSQAAGGEINFHIDNGFPVPIGSTLLLTGGGTVTSTVAPVLFDGNDQFFQTVTNGTPDQFRLRAVDGTIVKLGLGVLAQPGTITFRQTDLATELSHTYAVSSLDAKLRESALSPEGSGTNNLFTEGASNLVQWTHVESASRYRVYRKENGIFGFLGEVDDVGAGTQSFKDDNIEADFGRTASLFDTQLTNPSTNPQAVAHFEQRRVFAFLQRVLMTRTGTENDLSFHIPLQDDDRIQFDVASREAETIQHIVPLAQLILLTSSAEYRVTPVNSDAITPTSVAVRPQSFIGASPAQPVIVNNTLVFGAARGGHVRELGFSSEQASFITGDLSLRAAHLFDRFEVKDFSLLKAPIPIVFAVSTSGALLGLTYAPEEQIGAWHAHETINGAFESHTVISEDSSDTVYVSVLRTINASPVRYIECIQFGKPAALVDNFFVDSGLTYSGAATTTITGLSHLQGQTVVALADGIVRTGLVVSGGAITLPVAASKVHVGLQMVSTLETLPLLAQIPAFGQGNTKNIDEVWVRVTESVRFQLGASESRLVPSTGLTATVLADKKVPVVVLPDWNQDGTLVVRQADPLPLTVVDLTIRATAGG